MATRSSERTPRRGGSPCIPLVALVLLAGPAHATAAETAIPACDPAAANTTPARAGTSHVRLVTGAPYSALGTSETVTTAADGSRIVHQNTMRMWRDSDGRTRSEYSLTSIAGPTPVEINSKLTVIDDPTTRERYVLRPDGGVTVIPIHPCRVATTLEPDITVGPPRPPNLHLRVSPPVRLGMRTVNGEPATGSRVEATIPAGAMGNDEPVKMSAEQWYGTDLKVVVEATYRDPRTGETRYQLREIQRSEPDASLFRVPDDKEEPRKKPPPRKQR